MARKNASLVPNGCKVQSRVPAYEQCQVQFQQTYELRVSRRLTGFAQ
jgi:hypothetical protein